MALKQLRFVVPLARVDGREMGWFLTQTADAPMAIRRIGEERL